ncbi:PaaI family thioesterase [Geomicrobium sp. JCM 19039]|uniref:PaaI family thioesterase n=1 Tax=Geomicrobium sp. JCM 19039 TaxID=1460636 RepID=UPI00045F4CEA|nr:PaaI family thioesterase [Geomicrobium sp. JCM 19039]GAK11523.1 hypothetical protein JCM19039_1225 [Geomicrobium sp. JCM 19039]
MLDNVFGATIHHLTGCKNVTVTLNIHYLSPVNSGTITARCQVLHMGYKLAALDGFIYDEDGSQIAKSSGTFKLLRGNANV